VSRARTDRSGDRSDKKIKPSIANSLIPAKTIARDLSLNNLDLSLSNSDEKRTALRLSDPFEKRPTG
jgi:hypothetical protein